MIQKCEWCEKKAFHRFEEDGRKSYQRYSCKLPLHKTNTLRLIQIDTGMKLQDVVITTAAGGFEIWGNK